MVSTFTLKSLDSVNIPFPLMSADGPVPPEGVPPLITVHSNLSSLRCLTPEQSLPESKLQLRPTGREFKRVSFYSLCFSLKVFKSPFQCFYVGARKTVSNSKLECLPKLIFFFFAFVLSPTSRQIELYQLRDNKLTNFARVCRYLHCFPRKSIVKLDIFFFLAMTQLRSRTPQEKYWEFRKSLSQSSALVSRHA